MNGTFPNRKCTSLLPYRRPTQYPTVSPMIAPSTAAAITAPNPRRPS